MRRALISLTLVAAVIATLCAPLAHAATPVGGGVWLYDNGATGPTNTDWKFYVQIPDYVALDDTDGYWNFTVYAQNVDPLTTLNGTWAVTIYINDGTTNLSAASGTIVVTNATVVYKNISIADTSYSALVENQNGLFYAKLTKNATVCDGYVTGIPIAAMTATGIVWSLIPFVISIMVIMMVITLVTGFMVKMTQTTKRREK